MPYPAPPLSKRRPALAEDLLRWTARPQPDAMAATVACWSPAELGDAQSATQILGCGPLLAWRLGANVRRLGEFGAWLELTLTLNRQRMVKVADALRRLLAGSPVPLLPLKGSAMLLAGWLPDPGTRCASDIDVLVRAADRPALRDALPSLGFTVDHAHEQVITLFAWLTENGTAVRHPTLGDHPDNPLHLEVHSTWQPLMPGVRFDLGELLWAEAAESPAGVRLPSARVMLAMALAHAARGLWNQRTRAQHLLELPQLAARLQPADWDWLVALARTTQEARVLYPPLALAEHYAGPFVPHQVRRALATGCPWPLRAWARRGRISRLSLVNPQAPLAAMLLFTTPRHWPEVVHGQWRPAARSCLRRLRAPRSVGS